MILKWHQNLHREGLEGQYVTTIHYSNQSEQTILDTRCPAKPSHCEDKVDGA